MASSLFDADIGQGRTRGDCSKRALRLPSCVEMCVCGNYRLKPTIKRLPTRSVACRTTQTTVCHAGHPGRRTFHFNFHLYVRAQRVRWQPKNQSQADLLSVASYRFIATRRQRQRLCPADVCAAGTHVVILRAHRVKSTSCHCHRRCRRLRFGPQTKRHEGIRWRRNCGVHSTDERALPYSIRLPHYG